MDRREPVVPAWAPLEGMQIKSVSITPAVAREILHARGRRGALTNRAEVEEHKAAMRNGTFGAAFVERGLGFLLFTPDGRLLSGHHKLVAISEMPEDFAITFEVGATAAQTEGTAALAARYAALSMGNEDAYPALLAAAITKMRNLPADYAYNQKCKHSGGVKALTAHALDVRREMHMDLALVLSMRKR